MFYAYCVGEGEERKNSLVLYIGACVLSLSPYFKAVA